MTSHQCIVAGPFPQKNQLYTTLVLTILVYVLPGAKRLVKAPADLWSKDANSILEFLHLPRPSKCPEIKIYYIYSWVSFR